MNKKKLSFTFSWKIVAAYLLLLIIFLGIFSYLYFDLTSFLKDNYFINEKITQLLKFIGIRLFSLCALAALPIFIFLYFDINNFIKKINTSLQEALSERKLESHFNDLFSGKTFSEIYKNLLSTFSIFKSFDNMKTTQISVESSSLKVLLNLIDEGAILVNQEKIVTHINHPAEIILKLIPGEIINQTISRQITNQEILDNLDKALEKEIKTTNLEITLKGEIKLLLNISLIKNKAGETARALIIFKEIPEAPVPAPNENLHTTEEKTDTKNEAGTSK
ncbi:PAS domain-containing protein [Candidatus Margulisiibacteriota bacterium]